MVRISPRVRPGMRTSPSSPSSWTTRSGTGVEGGIDGASIAVDVDAGEGAVVGVDTGASVCSGTGADAGGGGIVVGKSEGAGAGIGAVADGEMSTTPE